LNLYVDIGNSRIRLAWGNDEIEFVEAYHYTDETLATVLADHHDKNLKPVRIIVSNVAGKKTAGVFNEICCKLWGKPPEYLGVSKVFHGLTNGYRSYRQLGVDRWLAMVAARDMYTGSLCVVDCGTAVTVDIVSADGHHRGGYIIPGHYLMQKALAENTGQLSVPSGNTFTRDAGRSTGECIYNGTLLAVASLIEHIAHSLDDGDGFQHHCIITGGGATELMQTLKINCSHEPLLVIEGIKLAGGVS